MMEKLFNSSIEQATGTSPDTLIFGGFIDANHGFLMTEPELTKSIKTQMIHTASCEQTHAKTEHTYRGGSEGTTNTKL